MEEVNVVVPPGFSLEGACVQPTRCYVMEGGLGVLLAIFTNRVRVKPADVERELLFRSDDLVFQDFSIVDKRGFEIVDPNPVEVPVHLKASPSMRDMVVEQISRFMAARAMDEGFESLEEAMDFDVAAELDDLQSRAEGQFLATFMPHEGRASNAPKPKEEEKKVAPVVPADPAPNTPT